MQDLIAAHADDISIPPADIAQQIVEEHPHLVRDLAMAYLIDRITSLRRSRTRQIEHKISGVAPNTDVMVAREEWHARNVYCGHDYGYLPWGEMRREHVYARRDYLQSMVAGLEVSIKVCEWVLTEMERTGAERVCEIEGVEFLDA